MSRVAAVLAGIVVLLGGGYGLLKAFEARDDSGIATAPELTRSGDCPGKRVNVTRDGQALSDDELRTALAQGNVVMVAGDQDSLQRLGRLQALVSGRFDPELAAAGQMVIRARGEVEGVLGRAWGQEVGPTSAEDPALREFAEQWLGRGAGEAC